MHSPGRSVLYSCTHQGDQCRTPVLTRQIGAVGMHSPGRSVQYSCTHQRDQHRTQSLTRQTSAVLMHSPEKSVPYSCTHQGDQCRTHALGCRRAVGSWAAQRWFCPCRLCSLSSLCCGRLRHQDNTVLWKIKTSRQYNTSED